VAREADGQHGEHVIDVAPLEALADEPVRIRFGGLPPWGEVRLVATTTDDLGRAWSSDATFRADQQGTVDLERDAPVSGAYVEADPMGFVWSMVTAPGPPPAPFRKWTSEPLTIHIELETSAAIPSRHSLCRLFARPGVARTPVDENGLVGTYYAPEGDRPRQAVLVLGGSNAALMESTAALLASRGLAALALAYFGRDALPRALVEVPLEYFETAMAWLRARSGTPSVSLLGTSKGAEVALLLASRDPAIRAVVAYCPSAYVFMGIVPGEHGPPRSSWTAGGRSLPFLPLVPPRLEPSDQPGTTTPVYAAAVERADRTLLAECAIPVERMHAALLMVSGGDDGVWPAEPFGAAIIERLAAAGHPAPRHHLVYPDAGHTLLFRYVPTTGLLTMRGPAPFTTGGTAAGNAHALADSWPRVVDFLLDPA
jgi:hypothetical protein